MLGRRGYPAAVLKRVTPILVLTTICWLVFLVNNLLWGGQFDRYGIRPRQLSSLPVVCILGYGGLVWGIVPTSTAISWESHLGGLLAGTAVGWLMAKLRKTPTGPKDLLPGNPSQP